MADDLASLGSEFMSEFGLTPEVFRPRVASLYEAAAHEFQSGASRMAPRDRVTAFLQAKLNSRRSQKEVDSLPGPIGQTARNVLAAAGDLTTGEEFARLGLAISEGSMEPMTSPSYRVQAGDIEGVDEVGQQTLGGKFARAGERFAALAYPDLIEDNRPLSPAFSPVGIAERVAQAAPAALQIAAVGGPVGGAARAVLGRAGLAAIGEGTTMAARGARLATSGAQGAATMATVGAMGRAGREDQRVLDPGAITEDAIVGAIFGLVGQLADEHVASRLKRTPEYQAAAKSVGEEMATAIGRSQVEEIKRRTAEAAINAMRQKSIPMSMLRRLAMAAPGTVAEFSAGVAADMASGLPFDEAVVQGLAFAGADLVDFRRRANFNVDAPTIARDTMGNIERAVADRQARAADAAKTERQQIQQRVEAARAEDSATGASAPSDAPTIGQPPRGVTEVVGASVADTPRPEATFNEEGMQEGRQEGGQEGGREGLLSPPDSAAIPPVREEAVAATPPPLPDQPTTGANDERATGPQPVAGGNDPDAGAPGGDRPGALPPSGDAAEAAPVADAGGAVREVVEGQAGGRGEALPPPLLTPDEIAALNGKTLAAALEERDLPKGGNAAQKRARLERYAEGQANAEPTVVDDVGQGVRVTPGAPMRTRSGRLTTAVPEDRSTKATGTTMDAWLHAEAAKEAAGSDYLSTLVKGMNPNRLSPSDREMLSSILFGRDVDTSERDPMMRRLRPLAEQQTSPAAETTPQGGDPAATPTVGEEATPTPAGDARPASEAQVAGGDTPSERLPFTTENLKSAMNLTDEQAEATMAVAEAMGLDPEQITLARGQEPGLHALPQAAWHGTAFDFDKFSTDKIGAGEGAQAFGWGIYFADSDAVAKHYRRAVTFQRGEDAWFDRKARSVDGEAGEWLEQFAQSNQPKWLELYDPQPIEISDVPMPVRQKLDSKTWYDQESYADSLKWLAGKLGLQAEYESAVREASETAEKAASAEGDNRLFDQYFTEELGLAFADKALEAGYKIIDWSEYFGPQKDLGKLPAVYKLRHGFDDAHQAPIGIRNDRTFLATMEQLEVPARRRGFEQVMNQFAVKDNGYFWRLNTERLKRNGLRVPEGVVAELDRVIGDGEPGFLYRVDLDVSNETLAQWDTLMAYQPEMVRDAYSVVLSKPAHTGGGYAASRRQSIEVGGGPKIEDMTLGRVHKFLESMMTPKELSMELARLGVSGIKFMDANSRRSDSPRKDYNYVIFDDSKVRIDEVFYQKNGETRRAAVDFDNEGRAVIYALEQPDVSSGIHELAHVARRTLLNRDVPADERVGITDQDIRVAERWAGASKDGEWDTKAEEKFARGFEKYLRDGKAPEGAPAKLVKVFAKFKQWLTDIYAKVKGSPIDIRISKQMLEVFDKLVTRDQTVMADARRKKRLATEARKKTDAEKRRAITSGVAGKETKADRPAAIGKDEPYRYEVVDLNEAIPSHLWSGDQIVKNPDFPEAIQGRDLTTKAARLDIEQKVKNFAPSKMVADGEQGEVGSPIIGDGDNYLDAGRQRWLVLDRVRDKKPDQYRAYVDELKARTDQHGISSEEIDRMVAAGEHPMLVRRRLFALDPTARRQYAQDLDTPRVGERNISDQAAADADVLEPEVFSLLKMGRAKTFESALGQKANLDFVSEFIRRVPRTMRARFTDGEGNLSADGVARIKAALMYKALQGESGRRLIDMATRFDNTGGNIIRGIEIATPRLAMLEAKMADGEVDLGFRISDSLSQAIEIAMAPDQLARLDGGDDMFADGGRLVPYDVEFMAKFLADNRKFPTKIGELLSVYADHAMGGATSRIDAVRAALAAVGDQGELFSAPTSKQIAAAKQKAPKSGAVSNDKLQRDLMSIVPDVPTFTKKGLGRMPSKPGGKLDTNIRGKFDIAKRLIFMARRDDVSTRAHEVGHVVDDGLKITADLPDELRADILSLAGPQIGADAIRKIGNGPIPDTVKAEAFAEWFRALIVNPDEARRLYTIAHEHFLAKLSATEEGRTVLERATKVSDDVIETLASTPRAQLTAQLSLNLEADRNAFQKIKAKAEADFDLLTNDPVGWKNRYGTALAGLARKIGHRFMYQYVDTAYKFQRSIESVLMGQKRTLGDLRASANPLLLIRAIAGLSGEIQGQFRNGFIDPFQRTKRSDDGKTITENVVEGTSVTKDVFEKLFGKSEEDTRRIVSGWHAMNQAKRLAGLRDSTQRRLDSILIRVDDEEAEVKGWPFLKGGEEAEARYVNRLRDADDAGRTTLMAELEAEREAFLDGLARADLGLEDDGEARGFWRDADAIMEETRAEFSAEELKRMDEASDAYRRIMKVAVLDNLLEAGNMPQSRYDRFIEHQDFYFGFQRDMESLDVDSVAIENKEVSERVRGKYNELAQSGRVIHRLGGSSRSFQDQLVSMGLEIERAMRAAAANRAKRATAALLEYQPTGETRKFQDDYKPESAVAFVSDEPLSRNGMEPVAFRDGGRQRYLVIGDPDFASVFRDTRSAPMGLDNVPVMRALAWYAKWQRSTITTTPWFVIRQLIRDPLSTAILSRNGTTARQIWGALIKSWMGKFDAQSKMQQFEAYGGSAFSYERLGKDGYGDIFNRMAAQAHEQSAGAWVVHHPGTALKAGWNWWRRHIVEPSEYLSRIVEMENALKRSQADPNRKEWTDYDHMLWAVGEGRALMDFAVAGEVMRTLNKYAPFTTAAMRGVARAAEAAVDDPRGFAERIIKVSILPAMAYAAYIAMLPDEAQEEYEQMPARLRDLTFPIYVGSWLEDTTGVRWVMVPKPYELGVPGSIVQRFIAHTMGEPNAFDGLGESMMQTIVPVQPKELLFGGTTPIVEWITNRSLWDNRPIVPPWDEGRDVKLRDTSSASVLGQTIERLSGYRLDARKADWLVRQGVGGWAQAAMGLSDLLRADRGELTWGIGAGRVVQSTGLVRGTTAGYGKDVTASFDLAQRYGLTQAPQVVALRRQLERFHTARTPAERRSRAEAVRARSRETRAWLERQGARADRAGARVRERQRRETFGR